MSESVTFCHLFDLVYSIKGQESEQKEREDRREKLPTGLALTTLDVRLWVTRKELHREYWLPMVRNGQVGHLGNESESNWEW
jgi:hypothetical protein